MWQVLTGNKVSKQVNRLPKDIREVLYILISDLKAKGPVVEHWQNYGKIKGKKNHYHCHLNKGKPRYVAVWKVTDYKIRLMEVRYVGTHENADYQRIN